MMKFLLYFEDKELKAVRNKIELIEFIRKKPLKKRGLVSIAKRFHFNQIDSAKIAGISVRTFQRRKPNTFLSPQASELSLRLAELYETGMNTFDEDNNSFIRWMDTPIPGIQNKRPNEIITTSYGIDLVKDELLRIEHGVY